MIYSDTVAQKNLTSKANKWDSLKITLKANINFLSVESFEPRYFIRNNRKLVFNLLTMDTKMTRIYTLNKKFELWIQLNNEINLHIISFGIFTFAFYCSLFVFHLCGLFLGFCSITLGCCNVRKYEIRRGNSICYLQESPEEIQISDVKI